MRAAIVALVFVGFFRLSTSQNCGFCELKDYYNSTNGYQCVPFGTNVLCTCPGGRYEINVPCRLCNNLDPNKDACKTIPGQVPPVCIEHNACGTSYYCLCQGATPGSLAATLDADCDLTNTLNCPAVTGGAGGPPCLNGGVRVDAICHCPAGFSGALCQDRSEYSICPNIRCKSNGLCGVHNPTGPYEAVCRCRAGTWGEYCHLNGTVGSCSSNWCQNGGACQENVVGSTRYVYCLCPPGYKGNKCETLYFTCTKAGKFDDADMHDQSGYFECTKIGTAWRIERRACPKGLRFNETRQLCTY